MLLISVNRSGRPGVSGLWVSRSVGVACLLGRLRGHASISVQRNTSRRVCLRSFCGLDPYGHCSSKAQAWIDFSNAGRQKEFHNSYQCAAWTCTRCQCDQSGGWLFARPSSEACLRGDSWEHCWMLGTPPSSVWFRTFNDNVEQVKPVEYIKVWRKGRPCRC